MGGSTKKIKSLQIKQIMEEYGGLKERLFRQDISFIKNGMKAVNKARQRTIIDVKSLYNPHYMKAMGYDYAMSGATLKTVNRDVVFDYIHDNIDSNIDKITLLRKEIPTDDTVIEKYAQDNYTDYNGTTHRYMRGGAEYELDLKNTKKDESTGKILLTSYKVPTKTDIKNVLDSKYDEYEIVSIADTFNSDETWDVDIKYTLYTVKIKTTTTATITTTTTDEDGNKTTTTKTTTETTYSNKFNVTSKESVELNSSSAGNTTVIEELEIIRTTTGVKGTETIQVEKVTDETASSIVAFYKTIKNEFEGHHTGSVDAWLQTNYIDDYVIISFSEKPKYSVYHHRELNYSADIQISLNDDYSIKITANNAEIYVPDDELGTYRIEGRGTFKDYLEKVLIKNEIEEFISNNEIITVRYVDTNGNNKLIAIELSDIGDEALIEKELSMMPNIPIKKGGSFIYSPKLDIVLKKVGLNAGILTGNKIRTNITKEEFIEKLPSVIYGKDTKYGVLPTYLSSEQIDEVTEILSNKNNEYSNGFEWKASVDKLNEYGVSDDVIETSTKLDIGTVKLSLGQEEVKYSSISFGVPLNDDSPAIVAAIYNILEILKDAMFEASGDEKTHDDATQSFKIEYDGLKIIYSAKIETRVFGNAIYKNLKPGQYARREGEYTVIEDGENTITVTTLIFIKQYDGYYVEKEIKQIDVRYEHDGTENVQINTFEETFNRITNSSFTNVVIPMFTDAFRKTGFNDYCDVIEKSLIMMVYTEKEVHLHWYQTGFFGFIVKVIIIIVAVVTENYELLYLLAVDMAIDILVEMGVISEEAGLVLHIITAVVSFGQGISNTGSLAGKSGVAFSALTAAEKIVVVLAIANSVVNILVNAESLYLLERAEQLAKKEEDLKRKEDEIDQIYKELNDLIKTINPFVPSPDEVYGYVDYEMAKLSANDEQLFIEYATDIDYQIENLTNPNRSFNIHKYNAQ